MKREQGFTLLEVLIALAMFAVLGAATSRLFDTVVRAERQVSAHANELRALQRALALIERDVLHSVSGLGLEAGVLSVWRGHWANPLALPRSEFQAVTYRYERATLWRLSRGDHGQQQTQALLAGRLLGVQWRLLDSQGNWHASLKTPRAAMVALEVSLSTERFGAIRRIWAVPGAGT